MKKLAQKFFSLFVAFTMALGMVGQLTTAVQAATYNENFDTDANWSCIGVCSSYANVKTYANPSHPEVTFEVTEGLRDTNALQDGVAGTHSGAFSWRVRNTAYSYWQAKITSGGVGTFSFWVRRWDFDPDPSFSVEYSTDNANNWSNLLVINNTWLGNSSAWSQVSGTINVSNGAGISDDILIRVRRQNTGERIMIDDFSMTDYIADAAPSVSSTTPADGATAVAVDSNVSVTFSEPVDVSTSWASLVCTISGNQAFGYSGGPTTFVINPSTDFNNSETCTLTIYANEVTDQDTDDPPNTMVSDFTASFQTAAMLDNAPTVTSTTPADEATNVAIDADVVVNFSEPVSITSGGVNVSCSLSGAHTVGAILSNSNQTITLDPSVNFGYSETCTITVTGSMVSDTDINDPPDTMSSDAIYTFTTMADPCLAAYTPIYTIQGSGATVALTGSQTTRGVVIGDYEGASPALRGFYIQDPIGDGNPGTSDGIFVFEGSNSNTVNLGDVVLVNGNAGESNGQSQISVGTITKCGIGTVAPTDVVMPFTSSTFLEQYEGMLVRFPQQLFVTEHFQLGRFGQVVLSSGDRLDQPTAVTTPGVLANALQASNNLNKILLDDASQIQNPDPIVFGRGSGPLSASNTLRGGDTITDIVGVMTYTWGGNAASPNAYRIRPINALNGYWNFAPANPRPLAPPSVGGSLTVVGMNLLNYFNTFDGLPDTVDNCNNGVGGAATDCRGADTAAEFDRQWPKTISAIVAMDPDVLGVVEIENDGYDTTSTLQDIVTKLNNATSAGKFAFIDVDTNTGQVNALGTDAIKVGLIYQPGSVTPVGVTSVLNTTAFVNGGDSAIRNRPSLLQAFEENATGARFMVDVNHLKSKGSACDAPDAADGQGNCNIVRSIAVNELIGWLATDPTGTGDPDIIILGDLNSYAQENPIKALETAGYVNASSGAEVYSYVFDGQWGYLDYTLISSSLVSQSQSAVWHINADEPSVLDFNTDFKTANLQTTLYAPDPFRISDHDPILTGLSLDGMAPSVSVTTPTNGITLVEVKIDELVVTFTEDVVHDGGQFAADNHVNYMLVEKGANRMFDTLSCEFGVQPDDQSIAINSVGYDSGTYTATLRVNNGNYLPEGDYRLFVCGTSSIRDLFGNVLNNGRFDSISDFNIRFPVDFEAAEAMPATGFAPNRVTNLPAQTVSYDKLGDLWLEIPTLKVRTPIVGVPQTGSSWDVTWLGSQAGWLAGSAYPTALGNSVLTAHVWDALNKPGAFYALDKLGYGDRVIVHSYGKAYTYEVRGVMTVAPSNVDAMLKHQDDAWLTLVTCKGFNTTSDQYAYRTLVRAVLVDVK